jgi:hypothetical protein
MATERYTYTNKFELTVLVFRLSQDHETKIQNLMKI